MAVRIALQCSEADAHLILSEENSAARLLTRPGEAIYNDANGMVEGNNFFQVVWLSDERREGYLARAPATWPRRGTGRPPQQIVFEGNLPAVPSKNHLLAGLLQAADLGRAAQGRPRLARRGDRHQGPDRRRLPAPERRQPPDGRPERRDGARACSRCRSSRLAAQHDPERRPVRPARRQPRRLAARRPARQGRATSSRTRPRGHRPRPRRGRSARSPPRSSAGSSRATRPTPPTIYLFVYDLQRFRDLRKADDDFGFGGGGYGEKKADPPSKLFGTILRDGPPLGVHTLVWCDSLNNLNRTFDRQALREFEMRVLFQMSANDSSTLIDSPVASKLGPNRALFFSEEEGRLEKFRPYGLPPDDWLDEVRQQLRPGPCPSPVPSPSRSPSPPATATATSEPTRPRRARRVERVRLGLLVQPWPGESEPWSPPSE